MGEHRADEPKSEEEARAFMKALLADVRALERMLESGELFETGIRRVGAEQEMFLVDGDLRPASVAMEVLASTQNEPRLTTELGLFNLEANASPRVFTGACLSEMEGELKALIDTSDRAAREHGARVLLCGILPTLKQSDLTLANMTPLPRYRALNDVLLGLRGDVFRVAIRGVDEIDLIHDNVMLEACNTSLQLHFQTAPDEFAKLYNVAQLITGPVLAVSVNSPLFLGSRLWHETRVALFSGAIDDRSAQRSARGLKPRVTFGDQWVERSVLEIFREQIARFRVVLSTPTREAPSRAIEAGKAPALDALCLHNGTVYRWNRAVYGTKDGVAHLRIENRALPAGPTLTDEIANAAFFFGLMSGVTQEIGDPRSRMEFLHAKDNFFAAAQHGLKAQLTWLDGEMLTAADLVRERLLPLAREGLIHSKLDPRDIDRYLDVIRERVEHGRTGASWVLDAYTSLGNDVKAGVRERRLVSSMLSFQAAGTPVHEWPLPVLAALPAEEEHWRPGLRFVGEFMSTDLFTVRPDDLVDLAASVMDWEHIKHVPVEDGEGRLVGLVTHRDLLRLVARGEHEQGAPISVREIMTCELVTVTSQTPTLQALKTMRELGVGSLPVVDDGKLVGIITQSDLIEVAAGLLERFLAA